MTKKARRKC